LGGRPGRRREARLGTRYFCSKTIARALVVERTPAQGRYANGAVANLDNGISAELGRLVAQALVHQFAHVGSALKIVTLLTVTETSPSDLYGRSVTSPSMI
jgi:hypothetical protein